jgi:hypothetical protein
MDDHFREVNVRALDAFWESMRKRPPPIPGGSHSMARIAYETNRINFGFEYTQENLPQHERILIVSGGPGAEFPERVWDAFCDFKPDAVLATMSYFLNSWEEVYKERIPQDCSLYVVDMEVDAYIVELFYPKGWTGTAIWNGCKLFPPGWCRPERVYWVNAAEGCGAEAFNRDDLGPRIPMRTTGEVALYLAAVKMGAKEIGTLGIQCDGETYTRQRKYVLDILNSYEGKVVDFEGDGVVHKWLGGKAVSAKPLDCSTCPHFLPTAPKPERQGRCLVNECPRGVR